MSPTQVVINIEPELRDALRRLVAQCTLIDPKRRPTHLELASFAMRSGLVEVAKSYGLTAEQIGLGKEEDNG